MINIKMNDLIEDYKEERNIATLARKYNCSQEMIVNRLKIYCFSLAVSNDKIEKETLLEEENRNNEITIEDIKRKKYEDKTIEEVAEILNYPPEKLLHRINYLCKKHNIKRQEYIKTAYEKKVYDQGKKLVELYEFGYSKKEIATKYELSEAAVTERIKRFYKNNSTQPKKLFLFRRLKTLIEENKDLMEIEKIAETENKVLAPRMAINALKEYRKDIDFYYLNNKNNNRYNLKNNINDENIRIKNKSLIKIPKSFM